jgi:chromosome segregation ATPase
MADLNSLDEQLTRQAIELQQLTDERFKLEDLISSSSDRRWTLELQAQAEPMEYAVVEENRARQKQTYLQDQAEQGALREARRAQSEQELAALDRQVQDQAQVLDVSEKRLRLLESQNYESDELNRVRSEVLSLQSAKKQLDDRRRNLQLQVRADELSETEATRWSRDTEMADQTRQYESELRRLEKKYDAIRSELAVLEKTTSDAERRIVELGDLIGQGESQVSQFKRDRELLLRQLGQLG